MTILLTGATGFIGRHVLQKLLASGHNVIALVRPISVDRLEQHPQLHVISIEKFNIEKTELRNVDALIHLAAHGVVDGLNDWDGCFRVNLHESLALWRRAADAGIKRFIICGSCFEYGRSGERYDFIPPDAPLEPTNAYGASKAAASMAAIALAAEYKLELIIARPFHVYGEGEDRRRFWSSLRSAALAGRDFDMTIGTQIRDFIQVEQVAAKLANIVEATKTCAGATQIYNIGTGAPQSLADFAYYWWRHWHAHGKLNLGAVVMRSNEVLRYVPKIS